MDQQPKVKDLAANLASGIIERMRENIVTNKTAIDQHIKYIDNAAAEIAYMEMENLAWQHLLGILEGGLEHQGS